MWVSLCTHKNSLRRIFDKVAYLSDVGVAWWSNTCTISHNELGTDYFVLFTPLKKSKAMVLKNKYPHIFSLIECHAGK